MILGGWPRDSARKTIIDEAHQFMREAGVSELADNPAFCTGPRRSMCLQQYRVRVPQEDYQGMRDRMQKVISALNQKNHQLKGGRRLRAEFSKAKPERDRGTHRALVRRMVRALASEKEQPYFLQASLDLFNRDSAVHDKCDTFVT